MRILTAALALVLVASPAFAGGIIGQYLEARTCDIWTGPCFANAEVNITGKHAVLAWKIEKGTFDKVNLDGLSIVAILTATDTLGQEQSGETKSIVIVDKRATKEQQAALIKLAQKQGGELLKNVGKIESQKIEMNLCPCKEGGCATLDAGLAKIATRCLNAKHDKVCGNECAYYPPLAKDVKVIPVFAEENSYTGKGAGATWSDAGRRGAYLGSFELR
jgi:hypothetical protein